VGAAEQTSRGQENVYARLEPSQARALKQVKEENSMLRRLVTVSVRSWQGSVAAAR